MSFNPELNKQATELMFSNKKNIIPHPPICFNSKAVSSVPEHTHLEIKPDTKLSLSKHITDNIQKQRKGIGVIRFVSSFVPDIITFPILVILWARI